MPPVEEEEQGVFEEDDELDDSEGDDSDMEDDLDDDDDEEEEEEFPDVSPPPPSSQSSLLPKEEPNSPITSLKPNPNHHSATPARTAPQNGSIKAVPISVSDIYTPPPAQIAAAGEESRRVASAASVDDSRRLFQRLWTDEDEITILQGFLEFTTQRGTTHASHQYDTGPFYEQIKKQLQLEFNKNQLIEKLRRLKKKYRNVVNRMVSGKEFSFKSAHEQATFEISRKIWSASIKRGRDSEDDEFAPNPASAIVEFDSGFGVGAAGGDGSLSSERKLLKSSRRRIRMRNSEQEAAAAAAAVAAAAAAAGVAVEVPIAAPPDPPSSAPIPSIIEETVKSCLSPLFKELLQSAMAGSQGGLIPGIGGIGGGGLLGMNPLQLGIGNLQGNLPVDEKWRNQNILELEVYLKRIELMRDQIKSTLEELKSSTPSSGY